MRRHSASASTASGSSYGSSTWQRTAGLQPSPTSAPSGKRSAGTMHDGPSDKQLAFNAFKVHMVIVIVLFFISTSSLQVIMTLVAIPIYGKLITEEQWYIFLEHELWSRMYLVVISYLVTSDIFYLKYYGPLKILEVS